MRRIIIAARRLLPGVALLALLFASGCTTRIVVIVVATSTIQPTPTLSAKDAHYIQVVATLEARPTDTSTPTATPVPPTSLPSLVSPSPATIPPRHDVADLAYRQRVMDDCSVRIGGAPQCICVTETLISLADMIGYTYQKIFESWFDLWTLPTNQIRADITTLGLDTCLNP